MVVLILFIFDNYLSWVQRQSPDPILSIDLAAAEGQQNNVSYQNIQIGGVSQPNILVPLHAINYKNNKPARFL